MTLTINEIINENIPEIEPVKEVMDIYIPGIIEGLPDRNGEIWIVQAPPGGGKSSMTLSLFKNKKLFRGKFDNVHYFCPAASFGSVKKHPFEHHDKFYHDLSSEMLNVIYDELQQLKLKNISDKEPPQYNCVVVDDMADQLKDKEIEKTLKKILSKSRHVNTMFIFIL